MANPETCLHNVIGARVTEDLDLVIECVSCNTDLTDPKKREGKNYKLDRHHSVWVNTPIKRDGISDTLWKLIDSRLVELNETDRCYKLEDGFGGKVYFDQRGQIVDVHYC
jgi:hypothetical protein